MSNMVIKLGRAKSEKLTAKAAAALQPVSPGSLFSIDTRVPVLRSGDNLLYVLGSPLPAVTTVPENWQQAIAQFTSYEGDFLLIYWDNAAGKLVVCNDFLGFQPLYWVKEAGAICFSNKTSVFQGEADLAGWGAFIAMGHTLANDTLTRDVARIPPASLLVIDAGTLEITDRCYWQFQPLSRTPTVAGVVESYGAAIDLALDSYSGQAQGILLSGGYDSRLLAYMLHARQIPLAASIISHHDENLDADARSAMAIARQLGFPFQLHEPDKAFFSSTDYLQYLQVSDSEVQSLYLFISQLLQFIQPGVYWEGILPGFTLKSEFASQSELQSITIKPFSHPLWRAAESAFGKELAAEMWQAFSQRLDTESARYPDSGEGADLFRLANRARNRIAVNPFKVFQHQARILTPGMTRDFVQTVMSVPTAAKCHEQLYKAIFKQYFPAALTVPLVHGTQIDLANSSRPADYLFRLRVFIHNQCQQRPRLAKLLLQSTKRSGFLPSAFLNAAELLSATGSLPELTASADTDEKVLRLRFYWHIWQALRDPNGIRIAGKSL
ncbi:hypothetical protein H1D31_06210 [Alishewanella sp. BS5-314]|uniref:hypothetical protein n=1 Tax=Alishewanella sp. BS5-314 TaxID=2755587 RepID=UPI0021BB62E8|nr:hypothetical protein [Alishewanella sp. BS5-314]MCT8125617.1 hypothetical protein [Alishewanella sp. BS5-314]